ncbi:MAG: hypothetical protein KDA65_10915 [Planctomycetaceae bacterium]|nr:hypothetical protein [Planctomycetaceae bacterium]
MEDVYFYSMIIGGGLIAIQVILNMVGIADDFGLDDIPDGDFDVDLDLDAGDSNWGVHLVGIISLKSVTSAAAIFGIAGMAATKQFPDSPIQALLIATVCGLGVLYLVGWLIKSLYRLRYDGTVVIDKAVGETGTVYLKIPSQNAGKGKVTITLQERSMEFEAMTAGDEIATGTNVVVTSVLSPGVLEVTRAETNDQQTVEELT